MFNDLLELLESKGFDDFAFADDLAVNGTGYDRLNQAIEIIMQWTKENNMQINAEKSGIILWKNKNTNRKVIEKERIKGIPIVQKYKYLGIILDYQLKFKEHKEYIEEKLEKSIKMINIMNWQKVDFWKIL